MLIMLACRSYLGQDSNKGLDNKYLLSWNFRLDFDVWKKFFDENQNVLSHRNRLVHHNVHTTILVTNESKKLQNFFYNLLLV